MRRSQAFPSNYIGKDDLQSPMLATIKEVTTAMVKGDYGDEDKPIMCFRESGVKPLILNNCNWMTLEDAYGEESNDWHGKPVELYVDPKVMFAGKRVGGVRVRVPVAQQETSFDANALSLDEAVAACEEVGITKNELVQSIKLQGHGGYNSVRDTPHVLKIIENVKARVANAEPKAVTVPQDPDDDIPF